MQCTVSTYCVVGEIESFYNGRAHSVAITCIMVVLLCLVPTV